MVWIIICCVNAIGTKSKRNKEREPLIYFRSAREQGRDMVRGRLLTGLMALANFKFFSVSSSQL